MFVANVSVALLPSNPQDKKSFLHPTVGKFQNVLYVCDKVSLMSGRVFKEAMKRLQRRKLCKDVEGLSFSHP